MSSHFILDIRGYFEISVFETSRVKYSVETLQEQSDCSALFSQIYLLLYLEVLRHVKCLQLADFVAGSSCSFLGTGGALVAQQVKHWPVDLAVMRS